MLMNYKHGLSHTRIDHIYKGMIARCEKETAINYERYGGRGIHVCDEWKQNKIKFFEWAFENGYSDDLTLDRIDNNKDYSPDNCKWSTVEEQNNNRRSSRYIEAFGQRKTLAEWSKTTGIKIGTLWERLRKGWCVERALTQEVGNYGRKSRGNHQVAVQSRP